MRAVVHVTLKKTVLDPQGRTIRSALNNFGYTRVQDVRQGKFFEIEFAQGTDAAEAEAEARKFAHDVLANPVIEEFTVEFRE